MRRACSSGHHGLLGQSGATSVMVACSRTTLARSLLISASGGKHQLFSLPMENRRPSAAMQFGSGFQLTYLCTCLLRRVAKRSTECGPHFRSAILKTAGSSLRSELSRVHRESLSALSLSFPGRCTAIRCMPYRWAVCQISLAMDESMSVLPPCG